MTQIPYYNQNIVPINNGYVQDVPTQNAAAQQPQQTVSVTPQNGVTPIYQYPVNSIYNYNQNIQPANNGNANVPNQQMASQPVQQPVANAPQNGVTPVYNYPANSMYNCNPKQAASGVNIYICNPTGFGGPNTTYATMPAQPAVANASAVAQPADVNIAAPPAQIAPSASTSISDNPIATTKISENKEGKEDKDLIQITDDYVKEVENALRSDDEEIRNSAILELTNRFDEDKSRYEHPALNALMNIALQDPSPRNKLAALVPIETETAKGDKNTYEIVKQLAKSTEMNGLIADAANNSLIKLAHEK